MKKSQRNNVAVKEKQIVSAVQEQAAAILVVASLIAFLSFHHRYLVFNGQEAIHRGRAQAGLYPGLKNCQGEKDR